MEFRRLLLVIVCLAWTAFTNSVVSSEDMCDYELQGSLNQTEVDIVTATNTTIPQECQCVINVTSGHAVIEYNLILKDYPPSDDDGDGEKEEEEDVCGPMLYVNKEEIVNYAVCAQIQGETNVTNNQMTATVNDITIIHLFNAGGNNISGSISITANSGMFSVVCMPSSHMFNLHHCPCMYDPPMTPATLTDDTSIGKRFIAGFLAAFALLVVIGLIFLIYRRQKRKEKAKKDGSKTYAEIYPTVTATIPVPAMFSSDNPAFNPYEEVYPEHTSAAGNGALAGSITPYYTRTTRRPAPTSDVYAEIGDVSRSSSQLPFTPDTALQLGLQKPYYRGSTDSGLYSNPSDRQVKYAFEGPYATSTETLDSVERRTSTPTKPPLSPAQIEQLYAKPIKVKVSKQPRDIKDTPPQLPPVRYDSGDIGRTDESSHNVSRDTAETDV